MANNSGGGPLESVLEAIGGSGGNNSAGNTPGNGGNATANSNLSNNNTVISRATASAGTGGGVSGGGTPGAKGTGNAVALATTTGGFRAEAVASGSGSNATIADAHSTTSGGIFDSISLAATGPNHPNPSARTVAAIGGSFFAFGGGYNVLSYSTAAPQSSDVTNALAPNPTVTSALSPVGGSRTDLALVLLEATTSSIAPSVSTTFSARADFTLKPDMLPSGRLKVGLLDPFSNSTPFTSVHFSIEIEGATVENRTFLDRTTADSYFNDNPLDLGTIADTNGAGYKFSFLLEMTGLDNGAIYGSKLIVSAVVSQLPGDYNQNGVVDAADYVLWRKHNNTAVTLPNDSTPGTDPSDYNVWRSHFGQTAGSGSGASANAAVPEPATLVLLMFAAAGWCLRRGRAV
jgi:hypothetical protein